MLKRTLINNAIASAVYGLSAAAFWGYYHVLDNIPQRTFYFEVIGIIAVLLLYILCGFLLKPVKKCSFLSVVSVTIVVIIIMIVCMLSGEAGFAYYVLNPTLPLFFLFDSFLDLFSLLLAIIFLLSPVYPSLLMNLGMVIRKLVIRRRLLKASLEEQPHSAV